MYDKVKLWTARTRETPDVSKFLDRAKDQIDHETGEVCTFGSLEGLKVSIYTGGISIIGSLAKYLYPNNIYPLDRHTTAQAIEKLSDSLHINLNDAKVTGVWDTVCNGTPSRKLSFKVGRYAKATKVSL